MEKCPRAVPLETERAHRGLGVPGERGRPRDRPSKAGRARCQRLEAPVGEEGFASFPACRAPPLRPKGCPEKSAQGPPPSPALGGGRRCFRNRPRLALA